VCLETSSTLSWFSWSIKRLSKGNTYNGYCVLSIY
jgi:hypothetical protein